MFFSFDGVDGVGKSTQIRLLADVLRGQGREVVTCRDPGGTPLGEKLRALLLDHHDVLIHRRTEMLLYMASRAQLVEEVIRPALAAGKVVVSDRYLLANVAYQAHGGGLDPDDVLARRGRDLGGVVPNLVLLLDMPADKAAARIQRLARPDGSAGSSTWSASAKASSPKRAASRTRLPSSTPTSRRKQSTRKSWPRRTNS